MRIWSGSNWLDLLQALPAEKVISTLRTFAFSTALLFVAMLACEAASRVDLRRYLTRNFGTDLLYRFFYNGGIYMGLIYSPLARVVPCPCKSGGPLFLQNSPTPGPLPLQIHTQSG